MVALVAAGWVAVICWWGWGAAPSALPSTSDPLGLAVAAIVAIGPLAVLAVAAMAARTARQLRAEARTIRAELDAMRRAGEVERRRGPDERIERLARMQAAFEAEVAAFRGGVATGTLGRRDPVHRPKAARPPSDKHAPLPPDDIVRALDFPEHERDEDGFRILRAAMADPVTAAALTGARDVLSALARDGIFMDDLEAGSTDPVLWRAFAAGERGTQVAALVAMRDRSTLALTAARMRDAPTFRDAVTRFLEAFDVALSDFVARATDAQIADLSRTRTARAFMLCARVSGTIRTDTARS